MWQREIPMKFHLLLITLLIDFYLPDPGQQGKRKILLKFDPIYDFEHNISCVWTIDSGCHFWQLDICFADIALSRGPLREKVINMQHIRRREKRFSRSFGDCEKDISEFEGNPTDSDPGYEVNKKKALYRTIGSKCFLGNINNPLFSQSPLSFIF